MKFNQPEGSTPLNPDSQKDLIPALSTQEELNSFEQYNIVSATEWATGNSRMKKKLLTLEGLKQLHKEMFNQTWKWAGKFRTINTNIGVSWDSISSKLKELCDDVAYWIENDIYSLDEIAVRFHYRLVFIHPFPNGNGRHARLAADVFLIHRNLPRLTWGSKSILEKGEVRSSYIKALQAADAGDFEPILKFVHS